MRSLLREAESLGWEISRGSKHWKLRHPVSGGSTILPYGSHASSSSIRNIRSRLRSGAQLGLRD